MHEVTIAQSILQIAASKRENLPANAFATKISVRIGEMRNVENDSLDFAFENLKTLYEGFENCHLEMNLIKARAWCRQANHQYNPRFENAFCCEQCGSGIGQLIAGEELDLVDVVFDTSTVEENG